MKRGDYKSFKDWKSLSWYDFFNSLAVAILCSFKGIWFISTILFRLMIAFSKGIYKWIGNWEKGMEKKNKDMEKQFTQQEKQFKAQEKRNSNLYKGF